MSVTKRIGTGDYNLTTVASGANIIVTTDTLKIYGNLYVQGNSSVVNVANISTADPTITLNANVTTPFVGNSGLEIYRGPANYIPGLLWNESQSAWQITSNIANPSAYANIQAGGGGTVLYGTAGQLTYYAANGTVLANTTSNLTWNGANLLNITGNVETSGLRLDNINVTPPPAIATTINIIGNTSGNSAGGTGIYFNNNTESGELTSKTKAIAYSIIFG